MFRRCPLSNFVAEETGAQTSKVKLHGFTSSLASQLLDQNLLPNKTLQKLLKRVTHLDKC